MNNNKKRAKLMALCIFGAVVWTWGYKYAERQWSDVIVRASIVAPNLTLGELVNRVVTDHG